MNHLAVKTSTSTERVTEKLASGAVAHHWPCPQPPKATLLFQHGFGDYSERWIRDYPNFLRDLHERGFDIWAMDMWGHGSSPGQRSIVNVEKAIDDHIELRTRLTSPGKPPLILLGHSLGGLVSAGSVSRMGSDLAGVILLAPALPDPMSPIARRAISITAKIIPTWQIYRPQSDVRGLSRDPTYVQRWQADENCFHGQISYLLASSALDAAASLWADLGKWSVPVLLVHGDADTYTQFTQSRKLIQNIKFPDKDFYPIHEGRHDLLGDINSEDTWRYTLAWLEKLLG